MEQIRRSMRGREVRKEISKELDAIQGVGSNLSQFQKISFVYCKCSSQEEIGAYGIETTKQRNDTRIVIKRY